MKEKEKQFINRYNQNHKTQQRKTKNQQLLQVGLYVIGQTITIVLLKFSNSKRFNNNNNYIYIYIYIYI